MDKVDSDYLPHNIFVTCCIIMGKSAEEEQSLAAARGGSVGRQAVEQSNVEGGGVFVSGCNWIYRLLGFKCFLMLLLSIAVFLSALFWLPPFLQFADQKDLDLDSKFKDHGIVASFNVQRPVSFLDDNFLQLEDDIFYEIGAPTTKVVILSLEPLAGSNTTKVVFGVDPNAKDSKISEPSLSLIRASFASLVAKQLSLRLTTSLFGDPLHFEVLKFTGGITVIPQQSAFLLQKVQIPFNFTLNFSIHQIQENFNELTSQLKLGLHLTPYENLYMRLSNLKGSTVAPPTVVQSFVLLAVGNTPSMPRLKQLAQTISGSHSKNLGLNNTVFGRVKQVRLSSILQHSLHGGDGSVPSRSPSPAPLPQPHHHHHHHHHRHHRHHNNHLAPAISPAPATQKRAPTTRTGAPAPQHGSPSRKKNSPAPRGSYEAKPPGCQTGNRRGNTGKVRKPSHLSPAVAPSISPHVSATLPQAHVAPPTPITAPVSHSRPASSPFPNVVFAHAHAHPPTKSGSDGDHSDTIPSVSPSPSSSSAGRTSVKLAFSLVLAFIVVHLK
ncbi:hypothetical protein Ddye_011904 [Dipteronia dyeriana]|uniref:DUF7036 domain-containing protein n=1 Tax=Dipteronia dyeriana TaxID=168575 RepID=A0AAE0CIS1_9ROSI|nr:hypothetical protein Ddye_011904 [Dipteronia dyeriana]